MPLILTIPDELIEAIKLPKGRLESELKKEFTFFLYKKGMATMGVARRLAGISKWEFIDNLGERKIERHYSKKELKEDQNYAKGDK